MRAKELPARHDARTAVEVDQRLGFVSKPTLSLFKALAFGPAPGRHRRAFAHGQFRRQVFRGRDDPVQLVVHGPVDGPEAPLADHHLNREFAQDRADW